MSGSRKKKEIEQIIYGETVDLEKEDKEYEVNEKREDILLEFLTAPYDGLMDKIRNHISEEKTEGQREMLFMRYRDTGDSWELGYINMGLDFWKMIESVFINYKPMFYKIEGDELKELEKIDYVGTLKLKGSELDGFVE